MTKSAGYQSNWSLAKCEEAMDRLRGRHDFTEDDDRLLRRCARSFAIRWLEKKGFHATTSYSNKVLLEGLETGGSFPQVVHRVIKRIQRKQNQEIRLIAHASRQARAQNFDTTLFQRQMNELFEQVESLLSDSHCKLMMFRELWVTGRQDGMTRRSVDEMISAELSIPPTRASQMRLAIVQAIRCVCDEGDN